MVGSNNELKGMISKNTIINFLFKKGNTDFTNYSVKNIMVHNLVTARPNTPLQEAIDLILQNKISCLPVVDEDNKLKGIVTEHDFVLISRELVKQEIIL